MLLTHPTIADAAVIGVPDADAGERPFAYLVAAPGATIQAAEIIDHMDKHLSHYKQLARIEILDSIPKSASGKILRRVLRDRPAA